MMSVRMTDLMQFSEPPAQYDHPYRGQIIEQRLSALEIMRLCHGPTTACSGVSKSVCHLLLPRDERDNRLIALIRKHEIGHCNGWSDSHQNGRRVEYDEEHRRVMERKPGRLYFGLE
jgi:hypothetical protein